MRVYRCRLCGDPYIGNAPPTHCPFCGAPIEFMVPAEEWVDENRGVELSERSRKNLEEALELELTNAGFYRAAMEKSKNDYFKGMFKALSKVESEHASIICKLLGINKPEIPVIEASDNDLENVKESFERESRAIKFYTKSAQEAVEERVKEVFTALVNIESTHLLLDEETGKMFR
jgi:rubrerythrin